MIDVIVNYRNVGASEALDQLIEAKHDALMAKFPRLTSCHVTVSLPHHCHRHGDAFRVAIDVNAPDGSARPHHVEASHLDAHAAVRDAFGKIAHELQHNNRRRQGRVVHAASLF